MTMQCGNNYTMIHCGNELDLDPLDGFLHRCCHLWLRAFAWVAGDEPALLNIDDEGHDDDAADDDYNDDDDN